MTTIDLNADLGEGFGNYRMPADEELLALVSSANVACGFHAGDPRVMRQTVARASRQGVAIGAHPGYPDLLGFGRRELDASPLEITDYVVYQLGALSAFCTALGARLRYVKPHGALYNRAARDPEAAAAIAEAIRCVDARLVLLGLAGSALVAEGERAGLATAAEAFVDRAYAPDGTLLPRGRPGAVLHGAEAVAERAARMVRDHVVEAVDGSLIPVRPDSLCVHGDTPAAAAMLQAVRARLERDGVTIAPFAP